MTATDWENETPKGRIYLPGCTVEANDEFSKPGRYYVFEVKSFVGDDDVDDNEIHWFLSVTSEEERDSWMDMIAEICVRCLVVVREE